MRNKQTELLVGMFIVFGFLALAYLAIQVSGLAFTDKKDVYQIKARFDDIGGLSERAKVTVAGVIIGSVKRIEFDKKLYMGVVTMDINSDVDNLPIDSSVAILTSGLLGEKYLGITVGAEEENLTQDGEIFDTQSALVLENLIGQFLFNSASKE